MNHKIFEPYAMGSLTLNNRLVMAPLTRRRADNDAQAPTDLMALYYKQRSTAGLIVAEASQISPYGYGYTGSPGCYTTNQIECWKKITRALHNEGGKIFLQLWHVGPFSHRLLQPDEKAPVSASPVTPEGEILTPQGHLPFETSREMEQAEIFQTIKDYARAAQNAILAGFDGVEIHGAHAYLIDQFIMDGTNRRGDEFGGSIENRSRFLFMVLEEVLKYIPAQKVGLRLSPKRVRPGMADSNPEKTYGHIIEKLNDYHLAYLHLSEMITQEFRTMHPQKSIVPHYRQLYTGTLISCGGHTLETAVDFLDHNHADMIAFGKPFISNPDLVERLKKNAPLAEWDKDTFYHGGAKGYVDYPTLYTS
jgi:N-ethylmaleimide reductase